MAFPQGATLVGNCPHQPERPMSVMAPSGSEKGCRTEQSFADAKGSVTHILAASGSLELGVRPVFPVESLSEGEAGLAVTCAPKELPSGMQDDSACTQSQSWSWTQSVLDELHSHGVPHPHDAKIHMGCPSPSFRRWLRDVKFALGNHNFADGRSARHRNQHTVQAHTSCHFCAYASGSLAHVLPPCTAHNALRQRWRSRSQHADAVSSPDVNTARDIMINIQFVLAVAHASFYATPDNHHHHHHHQDMGSGVLNAQHAAHPSTLHCIESLLETCLR